MHSELDVLMCKHGVDDAYDDVSDAALELDFAKRARKLEIQFGSDMGVYTCGRCSDVRGEIITIKWIGVNKGDRIHTNYRSRLVGEEFRA